MTSEQLAAALTCAQCHRVWLPDDDTRWRAYLDCEDEIQVFCKRCAEREFASS